MLQYLLSLFDNFGLVEKISYFHGTKMSVTVYTNMPRNNKKKKSERIISDFKVEGNLHLQRIFFTIHYIITSLSPVLVYQLPSHFNFFQLH